ncbi:M1 family metallopeptidase [Sinomicrobium oceani]|uniref:M1 family metallopeptidase n=1 Tax=Sinomicrobium oceani TaxID=1150368 RepID=UPI00227D6118|nr:M1 family metallopeptidase [Sinomicrobium oceani]
MNVSRLAVSCALTLSLCSGVRAQEEPQQGHTNTNKFRQMYQEFSTPNMFRTASGAPGPAYYQQQADYKIDVELDDKNQKLYGSETITYINNSPDKLEYLWVQLDQNIRSKNSPALQKNEETMAPADTPQGFTEKYLTPAFDGGFNIEYVKDSKGRALPYTINFTMMRIDLPEALKPGEKIAFSVKWWYNINNHITNRARSGFEHFPKDGNNAYIIAQFFPRMAVYNDTEGWQNYQFWGNGEFALPFGNYEVNITVPADHVLEATGELQNRKDVFTKTMMERYEKATRSFDEPVIIVTQEEAEAKEKSFSDQKKTWKFKAQNVRDFAFSTSRKYILDAMAVKIGDKTAMAESLYPKEGNPLWEEYSTRVVAHTLQSYSAHTFDYPYPKAISVHAKNQGMEYPMICWNHGRPDEDGSYSDRVKYGMISVIIHEVGHNFFPMIVNSDERQWGWMDEGLNSFLQYLTEQDYMENYPSRRGKPSTMVTYMRGNQDFITPIMSNPENVYQLGNNAYGKPAAGLTILRQTVMGPELFDYAFRTYARRWMFKHPNPEDFFRTMEDASGVELDWFWRGWFYTTDYVDIGIKNVRKFFVASKPNDEVKAVLNERNIPENAPIVFMAEEGKENYNDNLKTGKPQDHSTPLREYLLDNFSPEERAQLRQPAFFTEITFEKPGGMPMPLIVEYTYADGTTDTVTYPVEIWRKNDAEISKVIATDKEIVKIAIDPREETADVNITNNFWPQEVQKSAFDTFKEKVNKP